MKHLYCELCQLQFDKKIVYDIHLSVVHKENQINDVSTLIKEESVENVKEESADDIKKKSLEDIHKEIVSPNVETLVHDGKKQHDCPNCESSFSQRFDLKNHIAIVHDEKEPFKCSKCNKQFAQKRSVKAHMKSAHEGKTHECSVCNSSFTT